MANDQFLSLFFEEARELLQALESGLMDLEARQGDRAHLDRTFRAAHTLKSTSASFGAQVLADRCREIEQAAAAGQLDGLVERVDLAEASYREVAAALQAGVEGGAQG